jgi:phage baseplate assembly protein W
MKEKNNSFLGQGWAFPPAFNFERGTTELVENEKDIKESIRIILGTIPGERVMFPTFGCPIQKFVFESDSATQKTMLKDVVYDALLFNEPRIKVDKIDIKDDTLEHGTIYIHVLYTVIITNTRNNIVYPFYFNEGTNL